MAGPGGICHIASSPHGPDVTNWAAAAVSCFHLLLVLPFGESRGEGAESQTWLEDLVVSKKPNSRKIKKPTTRELGREKEPSSEGSREI